MYMVKIYLHDIILFVIFVIMYIAKVPTYRKDKTVSHTAILLRRSYRENGKVKTETIANITHLPKKDIDAIEWALNHKNEIGKSANQDFTCKLSKSFGGVYLVNEIIKQLGIDKALGNSPSAKLAKLQIISRTLNQGSRLSSIRMCEQQALCEVLEIEDSICEDDLYENLSWLTNKQSSIERKLFKQRYCDSSPEIFLYDVTSSYFEGIRNKLASWGYNRDKKKGKMQVVAGLLCDTEGYPLAIRLFKGNTLDFNTVHEQVKQVANEFGCRRITFVGDRGMLKSKQIAELEAHDYYYITAITKPQVETLLRESGVQMSIFDKDVKEIVHQEIRYILRRNPVRAEEIRRNRAEKLNKLKSVCEDISEYLQSHPRSSVAKHRQSIEAKIKRFKLSNWLQVKVNQENSRLLELQTDNDKLVEESKYDGCYVIKSNLPNSISKEIIHDRYKDLSKVESGFRCMKTEQLELRPWFVRTEESTRGHAFVVMLSYMIIKYLKRAWKEFNITVEEGLIQLNSLSLLEITMKTKGKHFRIPEVNEHILKLFEGAKVKLPEVLPHREVNVSSRVKLRRKG